MKLLVFTYAPAGLGHLRVTDALADCRPENYPYIMLGSYDKFITNIHRFLSTNWLAKWIFTISQYGLMESIVTNIYRWVLVSSSKQIFLQLKDLIERRKDIDEVWIIATHFGMAHQIGAIKEKLMKETGVIVRFIVQVTDDTSQHIWCIKGTDLTIVPSQDAKNKLLNYAKRKKILVDFEVSPYPLSSVLTKKISKTSEKRENVFKSESELINVAVPVSGAMVGLGFISNLIKAVLKKSNRIHFWILVKKSIYSELFLSALSKVPNVHLITGRNDNEMISLYEHLYRDKLIHIEITKPSEQTFKAIVSPDYVGGALMLLSSPVGRQEYENMNFLKRHGLMGGAKESVPRAIKLPNDPLLAADFILWGLSSGLFTKMSSDKFQFSVESLSSGEIGPDGAKKFWEIVNKKFA